jgi:hypothetical protein
VELDHVSADMSLSTVMGVFIIRQSQTRRSNCLALIDLSGAHPGRPVSLLGSPKLSLAPNSNST